MKRLGLKGMRDVILERALFKLMFYGVEGNSIFREDWHNLVILDACRYDTFRETISTTNLRGRLACSISKATETAGFLRSNFSGSKYDDIVYVAANPFVSQLLEGKFHEIIPVWKSSWDEENQTVMPEAVYRAALGASERHPDKRLIVHFMQPHQPYIGYHPKGGSSKRKAPLTMYSTKGWFSYHRDIMGTPLVESMYRRNLQLALPWVEKLVARLRGKTIITSDHGESFGDLAHPLIPVKVYGHVEYARIPPLVRVPWFVVDDSHDFTPEIERSTSPDEELQKSDERIVEERLKALGYS